MPMPSDANAERNLTSDDRRLIDRIAADLRPEPMDAVRQVRFRVRIQERLDRAPLARWRGAALVTLAAAALAVVWVSSPGPREAPPAEVARVDRTSAAGADTPVLDALLDSEETGVEETTPEDYLPHDYLVLASYLDGNGADL